MSPILELDARRIKRGTASIGVEFVFQGIRDFVKKAWSGEQRLLTQSHGVCGLERERHERKALAELY